MGIHQPVFLERFDLLDQIKDGGTVLLNTSFGRPNLGPTAPGVPGKIHFQKAQVFT
jgi:hypothetical protein